MKKVCQGGERDHKTQTGQQREWTTGAGNVEGVILTDNFGLIGWV